MKRKDYDSMCKCVTTYISIDCWKKIKTKALYNDIPITDQIKNMLEGMTSSKKFNVDVIEEEK
jgi:hypothetical protein